MALTFNLGNLFSRAKGIVQRSVSSGVTDLVTNKIGLINHLKGFAIGAIFQAIPSLIWSFTALWQLFFQSALTMLTFDWNRPDGELDQQMKSQWNGYGAVLGATLGNALGYIVCGGIPATSLFAIDERMALYVAQQVGEEGLEEMVFNLAATIRLGIRNLAMHGFYNTYKNVRRWLKQDDNPLINQIFGNAKADQIKANWGEQDSQPFTIYGAIEERIERIPSAFWRNFTEETFEEAIDGCFEASYVVAFSLDGYFAQKRIEDQANQRVVTLQPDRTNEREEIVIAGPENNVKTAITQALVSHQLIQNRDVGQYVGMPVDDYVREKDLSLRIKFQLYSVSAPPYVTVGANAVRRVTITVPDVKRSALDWGQLRLALGGPNGYLWGRWRATARLGKNEYVSVFGATADEAEDRARAIMTLSNSVIQTITVTEERRSDNRLTNPRLQKNATRVYPGHVTIINRQRVLAVDQGRVAVNGNYIDKQSRFDLWRDTAPENFAADIVELLRFS
ncbi:MAG: hypothetical protein AAF282_05500 [Cyanobacteria bacterium P01_A01_bin.15]